MTTKLRARIIPGGLSLIDEKGDVYCQLAVLGERQGQTNDQRQELVQLVAALVNEKGLEVGEPPEVQAYKKWSASLQEMLPLVPVYMRAGLERYVMKGIRPGGFWCAILEGDRQTAGHRADANNRHRIDSYLELIQKHLPPTSYGNADQVNAWVAQRGLEATMKANGKVSA